MATQTEVVTVTGSEDQAAPDTVQEENDTAAKKENWLRRRFNKNKDEKTSRKPPGEDKLCGNHLSGPGGE